jgi:hypothetical protein
MRSTSVARERRAAAGADQARAGAQQGDAHLVRRAGGQQLFLGGAAAFGQLGEAGGGQSRLGRLPVVLRWRCQPRFDQVGQRQVHIVAAQDQVVADADARQGRLRCGRAVLQFHLDQAEVGGAAADVGHQHQARAGQFGGEGVAMAVQPVVQRRLRLFQQPQPPQAGQARGLQRECARAFVEGGGNGEHQVLLRQGTIGMARVPGRAQIGQVAGAGRQRRDLRHLAWCAPGQDGRGAVDAVVRQPALGRCN